MRFITEFELLCPYTEDYRNAYIGRHKLDIGNLVSDSFGWRGSELKLPGKHTMKWTLEIEAFPMAQWLEFRKLLFDALPEYDQASKIRILNALSRLESFGKPAGESKP